MKKRLIQNLLKQVVMTEDSDLAISGSDINKNGAPIRI